MKEHTWALFTLKVQVGPYQVTLFAHEFAPIAFRTVMALRASGEIREGFTSTDDATGHFTPTPEIRKQIEACFGHLIGAR